jgi:hypothetical protein
MNAYKFLKYIVATNRLHFNKLEGAEKLNDVPGDFKQYIIANHSPEKEKIFKEAKKLVHLQSLIRFSMARFSYFMEVLWKIGTAFAEMD